MSTTPTVNTKQMRFRENWNARPRFETGADGSFVGRNEYLQRLDSHFRSRNGGTILISGVRGVGKTALVDRALVTSQQELQKSYWENTWDYLNNAPWWRLIVGRAYNILVGTARLPQRAMDPRIAEQAVKTYIAKPGRWWRRFDPADRLIRRMHQASRSQLLVLKFSASDISGALADPGQQNAGKPRINPEKLLQSIIRKLHTMFDVAGSQPEANILQWSLRDKKKRQQFFATLDAAYKKSISKSYKEVISNSISALIRETRISTWEGKINAEKALVVLLAVAGGIVFSLMDWSRAWKPLEYVRALSIPTALTGYIIWNWGFKRTREKSSDQSRQSSFSYEYDYSLHQMRQDLEFLFSTLSPSPQDLPKAPYRCFLRTVVVFDELDKLERADQQLDDIVTHFKNFFTLSEAVFVFLTDHDFYEHLTRETVKAQLARHYPPQHTFFNTKMYLRKPEFLRFREAFFGFGEPGWIEERAHSLPSDAMLIDDLLKRDDKPTLRYEKLSLETLTQLYIQRGQYGPPYAGEIETQFEALQKQISSPLAQAQVWASQAARGADDRTLNDMRMAFRATNANSWKDPDAVSFLYYRREDFGDKDKKTIEKFFRELPTASLSRYESVDGAQFTLSDLARALCFQTRNHYFDLYNTVYDYVKLFQGGTPVLQLDESGFTHEMKLWSRYQQLLEIAFESARETNTSREYFNALLIESLYRVFDKRRSGENVKISEILFPPRDDLSAAADTFLKNEDSQTLAVTPVVATEPESLNQAMTRLMTIAAEKLTALQTSTSGAQNGSLIQINPFTDTDADKINRAIIRLLRLALAHNAIRGVSSNLEARLKVNTKPATLGDLEFAWNDDCHSIIRSVIREQHEQELVTFWQTHGSELELFNLELTGLWMPVPMMGESATMHSAISDLRSRAESVRLGQGTISGPDAGGLKASVGTWEYREALWSRAIVDRIRAEDDAEVIEEFDKPQTDPLAVQLVTRKSKIEADTPLHIRAVIRPRNTDYGVFLVVGPLPATAIDFTIVKSLLLEKTSLFWYVTGKDAPEANQPRPDGIYVYTSPLTGGQPPVGGAAMLFTVYSAIASKQRLETIAARLKLESKKEQIALLAQHAGTEVLGPIVFGSEMYALLSEPNLKVAIQSLTEMRERFRAGSIELLGVGRDWPPARAAAYVAADIFTNGHLPLEFVNIIERAVSKLVNYVNQERASQDFWLKQFLVATEDSNAISQALLESAIDHLIDTKMTAANVEDTTLRAAIREHFVPWLSNSIQSLAKAKNVKIESLVTVPDWAVELERQRRTLRSSPLPPAPTAPTTR